MAKITVLKVNIAKVKNYETAEVSYKTDDGKTKGMKVLSFLQKEVFQTLQSCEPGDVLDASFEQNNKGYWQFSSVNKTGEKGSVASSPSLAATPPTPAKGGNWETSEERANRQTMIVRQSSLSNTIAYFELTGHKKAAPEDVIAVAKLFEAYVFSKESKPVAEVE